MVIHDGTGTHEMPRTPKNSHKKPGEIEKIPKRDWKKPPKLGGKFRPAHSQYYVGETPDTMDRTGVDPEQAEKELRQAKLLKEHKRGAKQYRAKLKEQKAVREAEKAGV